MNTNLRQQFPLLQTTMSEQPLVYFDNGATTQKPQAVLDAVVDFYTQYNANVHRSLNPLAEAATVAYENARKTVAQFIGAKKREIIFTRGTTESLNLVAKSWGAANLQSGDRVILTETEHHANIVPWLQLKESHGIKIDYIPLAENGELDYDIAVQLIAQPQVKVVAFQLVSNTLGIIHRYEELIRLARNTGAITVIDAAQAMSHMPISVSDLGCDFLAFSAHKMYGPTGVGVLFGRQELLEAMPAWHGGGEMIASVNKDGFVPKEIPHKFEAGTPNIAGAIGMAAAIDFLNEHNWQEIHQHEQSLTKALLEALNNLPFVTVYGTKNLEQKIPSIAFNIDGIHAHDVGELLGHYGIAVRSGQHCTQPLHDAIGAAATVRASLALYNTVTEIDVFVEALKKIHQKFQ
jgi:cysteine desulfurase/selenocysteine lyase